MTKLLFMDESKADMTAPKSERFTSLTGALVDADNHAPIRSHFYRAAALALEVERGTCPRARHPRGGTFSGSRRRSKLRFLPRSPNWF